MTKNTRQAGLLWGKSSSGGETWLPLWLHLRDTYQVSGFLWDNLVPEKHKNIIISDTGLSAIDSKLLLQTLAGLHDLGKATPDFSGRESVTRSTYPLYQRMIDSGLSYKSFIPRHDSPIRHEMASSYFLSELLDVAGQKTQCLIAPISGHHGAPRTVFASASLGMDNMDEDWWDCAETLYEMVLSFHPSTKAVLDKVTARGLSWRVQIILSGYLVCSDWMASTENAFPLISFVEVPELGLSYAPERLNDGMERIQLPKPFDPHLIPEYQDLDLLFGERFDFQNPLLRPVQKDLLELVSSPLTDPNDIFVVEAPMGDGKTEAALLASEILMNRSGSTGIFFGLPTMATSEAIYSRFVPYVKSLLKASNQTATHDLSHSKSILSDEFRLQKKQAKVNAKGYGVIDSGWLDGKYAKHLNSFTVGTVDVFLMLALKMKYSYWRHIGLSQKVIIIDEVHSMDEHMQEFLKNALSMAGFYECPVILLSATLTESKRQSFIDAYNQGKQTGAELCQL